MSALFSGNSPLADYGATSIFLDEFIEGTKPFNLGRIDIYSTYEIDFRSIILNVRVAVFPQVDYVFKTNRDDLLDDTEAVLRKLAIVSSRYFMSITEPVPDNIRLGEN